MSKSNGTDALLDVLKRKDAPGRRFGEPLGTVAWHADGRPFTDKDYERAGMAIPTREQLRAAGIDVRDAR